MGEKGVGDEFGKFGGPEVGGDDAFARHPVCIDRDKCLEGCLSFGCLLAADEDAVRVFHIRDGGAFGEELGVGKNLEGGVSRGVGGDDRLDRGGGLHRDGGFLDDDLVAFGDLGYQARRRLDVAEICGAACADSV